MSQFRAYFYDLNTRKEMTDFEHNGKTWLQTSGMVIGKDCEFVQDTCSFVRVASYADMQTVKGDVTITADTFPGKNVAVKIWYGPARMEWRKLVKVEFEAHHSHIWAYYTHKDKMEEEAYYRNCA